MADIILYLKSSVLTLSVLALIYLVVLRSVTDFKINRVYLLLAIVAASIVPFIDLIPSFETAAAAVSVMEPVVVTAGELNGKLSQSISTKDIFPIIYSVGLIFMVLRLFIALLSILSRLFKSDIIKENGFIIVLTNKSIIPSSFGRMVFLSQADYSSADFDKILAHEKEHIRQCHTFDIILAELVLCIQWFNPFAWLLKLKIKQNHEYLADDGVISRGFDKQMYKQLLFELSSGLHAGILTNNLTQPSIKNRLVMMKKRELKKSLSLRWLIILPMALMTLGLVSMTNGAYIQTDPVTDFTVLAEDTVKPVNPTYPGGQEAMIKFISENLKYPQTAKDSKIEGTVYVKFVVDLDGSLTDVRTTGNKVGGGCDEEAVRVIKLMPKWNPGTNNKGDAVRVKMVLPIRFELGEE